MWQLTASHQTQSVTLNCFQCTSYYSLQPSKAGYIQSHHFYKVKTKKHCTVEKAAISPSKDLILQVISIGNRKKGSFYNRKGPLGNSVCGTRGPKYSFLHLGTGLNELFHCCSDYRIL